MRLSGCSIRGVLISWCSTQMRCFRPDRMGFPTPIFLSTDRGSQTALMQSSD